MATLYQLTQAYLELLALAEDAETDEQAIRDTLESLDGEVEEKVEGCAFVMKELDAQAEAIEKEIARLTARKKTLENNKERIKKGIEFIMRVAEMPKIKTTFFTFFIAKRAASVQMETSDISKIPERFLTVKEPIVNKTAIKEALKAGEDLTGIAHLEQGEGLTIL